MKSTHNNIFIFFNDEETTSQVFEIVGNRYPREKNNMLDFAFQLSDALDILNKRYRERIFYDVIILDLSIKQTDRRRFVDTVTGKQAIHDFVLVTNNCEIKKEDNELLGSKKVSLIPDINALTLISLLESIFEKKFHEKKFNLINRIDDIANLKIDYQQILDRIVKVTLGYLGLKICWVSLVDYDNGKLKIGALTGFGKYEEEYRKAFSIALTDKSITTECINKKKQIEYKDVLDKDCPYLYKKLAKKIGLKSVLLTPIFEKGEKGSKKVIATLNLYTDFEHEFQEDERELARIIASKTAAVLSMKGIYEKEKNESLKKLELIEKVAAEINKNVGDPKKVFKTIVEEGIKLVQAFRGCIKLCHKDHISCECHMNCKGTLCKREDYETPDITNYVINTKESLIIEDIDTFPHKDPKIDYKDVSSRLSVPLMNDGQVIGVIIAEHKEKNYFTNHHLQLFVALAKHAVIAIENTNRYKQLQKRLQSQMIIKVLIEETSKLEAIEDEQKRNKYRIGQLEQIIEKVLKETGKIFEAKSGYVVLAGFKSIYAIRNPKWQFGLSISDLPKLEIGVKEKGKVTFKGRVSITGKVIAEGKLYNCKNVAGDNFYLKYGKNDGSKSEIVVPLKFQSQTYGAFALDSIYENGFSSEDEEILESIATQMALLIKRFGYLNTLLDMNKPFRNIDNLERLYNEITDRTVEALDTEVSYLRILDRNELNVKGCTGISSTDSPALKVGEGISGKVAKSLKPAIVSNVQDPSCDYRYPEIAQKYDLFAKISVPILSITPDGKKDLIGVLNTYSRRVCNFTSLDLQLMLAIAEKASEAIKKAKLFKQLDDIARIDEKLTTTTTEKDVLQDIANIAKDLLDADQVVLYQYNSNIKDNFGFSNLSTASGSFKYEKFKTPAIFSQDSLVVLLLEDESDEFFVESYERDLMNRVYKNRNKNSGVKPFYQREELKSVIILKLTYKEEVVGILFINYCYQKTFSLEERKIAKTFANKAAIAISNSRKYEDIDRLHDVGNIIASESDIDNVLERIATNAQMTLNSDIVIVHRYDTTGKKPFHPPIYWGTIYKPHAILGESGEDNVKFSLIEKGKDVFAVDVSKESIFKSSESWDLVEGRTPRFAKREKIKSCAAMLLKVGKEIVGVMFINYRKEQKFDSLQRRKIEIFANQAAIAIRNANLIDAGNQTVNRISSNINAIQESGYAIVESLNKKEVSERDILKPILDKALELISVDMGYIGLSNKEERNTKVVVCSEKYRDWLNKSLTRYYPDAPWIKKHEKFDIFPDEGKESDYQRFADNPRLLSGYPDVVFTADEGVQSALRVPIYSAKEFLGMIVLESETPDAFSKIDAYTVMSLANQASLALQNYRKIKQLSKLREIDVAILRKQNDLYYILDVILKSALELVNKKYGEISLLIDEDTLKIEKSIPEAVGTDLLEVNDSISGLAILKRKRHYEPNLAISKYKKFVNTKKISTKSELVIPLIADENLIGVLNIESDKVKDFTKEDIYVLELLSGQAAIAIFLSQQRERLLETQKEAGIGYVTRESVHWVGNKIGPIKQRVDDIRKNLKKNLHIFSSSEKFLNDLKKDLEIIYDASESALAIKSDLIDPGQNKKHFDLVQLLRDCIEKARGENKTLEITTQIDIESLSYFWDRSHLERVFYYILKNAAQAIEDKIKAASNSEKRKFVGKIEIKAFQNGNYVNIEFADNGCGMPKEDMDKLYRPFFTTKGANRGSGVGLYFCKRTMTEIGGKISVKKTEPGVGTNFGLLFPVQEYNL